MPTQVRYFTRSVFKKGKLGFSYIKNRKGIFESILGGSTETKLLEVRVFDEATKKAVYTTQTAKAEKKGKSNCLLYAIGHDANKSKIWSFSEMDADHFRLKQGR